MLNLKSSSLMMFAVTALTFLKGQTMITNISSAPAADNALRQELQFATQPSSLAYVEYGRIIGADTLWQHTDVSGPTSIHQVTLTGLRPSAMYSCRIRTFGGSGLTGEAVHGFSTGALPFPAPMLDSHHVSAVAPAGFILTAIAPSSSDRYSVLFDTSGTIIWYQALPGSLAESTCQTSAANNHLAEVALAACDSIHTMRFDGKSHRVFRTPFDQTWLEQAAIHDRIWFHDDRSFDALVAAPDTITRNQPPFANEIVLTDALVRLDSVNFNLVATYKGVEDPQEASSPGGKWTTLFGPTACTWKDVQGFSFDFDNYPVLSAQATHQIQKFDMATHVAWTTGPAGMISIYPTDSLWHPSGILAPGDFTYYTYEQNRDSLANRLVKWYIDWSYIVPEFYRLWEKAIPLEYASRTGGSVEPVPGGKILTSSKAGGYIALFNSDGNQFGFWAFGDGLASAQWVERLYPIATFSLDTASLDVCASDTAFSLSNLGITPAGGYWKGGFLTGQSFNANAAGLGQHAMFYHFGPDSVQVNLNVSTSACGTGWGSPQSPGMQLIVHPNPIKGRNLTVTITGQTQNIEWTLFGPDGRRLNQGYFNPGIYDLNHFELETESWPRGQMLYLHFMETNGNQTGKWVLKAME